jgi:hypothetical protein
MSFSFDQGYVPQTIEQLMDSVRVNINDQFGTTYTAQTFVGTNFYKYFYSLIQRLQENEVKTAEIFLKLQDYFKLTNERISRPVVTPQGLIDAFSRIGMVASVKAPNSSEAGEVHICVDLDDTAPDYAAKRLEACTLIKDSVAAGIVSMGTESESIVLSNGQSFDFKFDLPNRIRTYLRLTLTLSENNQVQIGDPTATRQKLLSNIAARYSLGRNFEPQTYFTVVDAPWCSQVLLEYSDDNTTWVSTVFDAEHDDLFTFSLADTTLIEA